jgi:hypothetical protein
MEQPGPVESAVRPTATLRHILNCGLTWLKRAFFIGLWSIIFVVVSVPIIQIASATVLTLIGLVGFDIGDVNSRWVQRLWIMGPLICGALGFVLGILGILPCTERR